MCLLKNIVLSRMHISKNSNIFFCNLDNLKHKDIWKNHIIFLAVL